MENKKVWIWNQQYNILLWNNGKLKQNSNDLLKVYNS